jgi:hypothetical protein
MTAKTRNTFLLFEEHMIFDVVDTDLFLFMSKSASFLGIRGDPCKRSKVLSLNHIELL